MEVIISDLVKRFEKGVVSRRELIGGLTMLAAAGGAAYGAEAQEAPFRSTRIDHISIQVTELPRSISTPLMVGGVVYSTVGTRRAVVAVDAGTGEYLWMHRLDEGERAAAAPRRLSGRGLAYRDDGGTGQVIYVTPGY